MENDQFKIIKWLLVVMTIGIYACVYFLYNNYADKQKLKEAVESKNNSTALPAATYEVAADTTVYIIFYNPATAPAE